jgi:hypothetical protein
MMELRRMINWLRKHRFEIHLLSFGLMVLASIGMYATTKSGASGLVWILLGFFILVNIIAMILK